MAIKKSDEEVRTQMAHALEQRFGRKPVVAYKELCFCEVGKSALLIPVDHPGPLISNTKHVLTSMVIRYEPQSGEFETLNTIYRPRPALH